LKYQRKSRKGAKPAAICIERNNAALHRTAWACLFELSIATKLADGSLCMPLQRTSNHASTISKNHSTCSLRRLRSNADDFNRVALCKNDRVAFVRADVERIAVNRVHVIAFERPQALHDENAKHRACSVTKSEEAKKRRSEKAKRLTLIGRFKRTLERNKSITIALDQLRHAQHRSLPLHWKQEVLCVAIAVELVPDVQEFEHSNQRVDIKRGSASQISENKAQLTVLISS
jgi:hypothetical protein